MALVCHHHSEFTLWLFCITPAYPVSAEHLCYRKWIKIHLSLFKHNSYKIGKDIRQNSLSGWRGECFCQNLAHVTMSDWELDDQKLNFSVFHTKPNTNLQFPQYALKSVRTTMMVFYWIEHPWCHPVGVLAFGSQSGWMLHAPSWQE